ncbi:MAG TPA: VOC family protein [Opitutaceae bacterium]
MQKITPFIWYDDNAEEAVKLYLSVFKKGKILRTAHYAEGTMGKAGSLMSIEFELFDQRYTAINGGPMFTPNEAISFVVHCASQREVDNYWKKLTANGGAESRCGWLKDKFGVSWQIVPEVLLDLLSSKDTAKAARVMQAMLQMAKIDIAALKKAAVAPKAKRGK